MVVDQRPVVCYSDKGAGINDRISVIQSLLMWCILLNAKLLVDRPCNMLHSKHNNNLKLPCSYKWDRYINVTYKDVPINLDINESCSLNFTDFYHPTKTLKSYTRIPKYKRKIISHVTIIPSNMVKIYTNMVFEKINVTWIKDFLV